MKVFVLVLLLFVSIKTHFETPVYLSDPEFGAVRVEPKNEGDYELVWSDEFRGWGKPDPEKWGYELGYVRNFEEQYYTNREENVWLENGKLVIEARKEKIANREFIAKEDKNWRKKKKFTKYTSGSVTTKGLVEWKYAKIEVRARLPKGIGAWSAIWMLGANLDEVGWIKSGEIDIMENVGFDPNVVIGTVHTEAYNYESGTEKAGKIETGNPHDEYHNYAIEWTPDKIDFLVDEVIYYTFKNPHKTEAEWPFDQKFHLKLNTAVGGTWGGRNGIDNKSFPQTMYIDYVRVYQKKGD